MKPRASSGGVCMVGRTPYFHSSASTSSRYRYDGRSAAGSTANDFLHGIERCGKPHDAPRPLERVTKRRRRLDRPPDDRFDDLRELGWMCRGEEDTGLIGAFAPFGRDAEIPDGRVRIDQISGALVDAL